MVKIWGKSGDFYMYNGENGAIFCIKNGIFERSFTFSLIKMSRMKANVTRLQSAK